MTGLYTGQAIGGFGATVAAAFFWPPSFHLTTVQFFLFYTSTYSSKTFVKFSTDSIFSA